MLIKSIHTTPLSAPTLQDSSNLYISCNRLPGAAVSPECRHAPRPRHPSPSTKATATTTATTTTTTTPTVSSTEGVINRSPISSADPVGRPQQPRQHSGNILVAEADSRPLLYFLSRWVRHGAFSWLIVPTRACQVKTLYYWLLIKSVGYDLCGGPFSILIVKSSRIVVWSSIAYICLLFYGSKMDETSLLTRCEYDNMTFEFYFLWSTLFWIKEIFYDWL